MSVGALDHPRRRTTDLAVDPVLVARTRRLVSSVVVIAAVIVVIATIAAVHRTRANAEARLREEFVEAGAVVSLMVIAPLLTEEWSDGAPHAAASVEATTTTLRATDDVAHVSISTPGGAVVWSSDPALVGTTLFSPIDGADVVATTTFTDRARLLDIHTTVEPPSGDPTVVTVSYEAQDFDEQLHHVLAGALPATIGGTIGLGALVLAPALILPRRSLRARRERELILERLIAASDLERRRIAAEVHDGAVQDLVGVAFGLGSLASAIDEPPVSERLDGLATATRAAVRNLRSLLNSIYPVDVPATGWQDGLRDLVDGIHAAGMHVEMSIEPTRPSRLAELLLLRVAREALRNVAAHSAASAVRVDYVAGPDGATLTVVDNGRGFEPETAAVARGSGHLGLQLIRDLACELGSALTISSRPGHGTTVQLELGPDLSGDHR